MAYVGDLREFLDEVEAMVMNLSVCHAQFVTTETSEDRQVR